LFDFRLLQQNRPQAAVGECLVFRRCQGEKRTSGGRAKMALMTDLVDDLGIRSCPAA
jgi:hypothetical protein